MEHKKKPVNPLIDKFYKSLSPAELEAHKIAARPGSEGGLGSSYIVEKTPAFIKWLKKQEMVQSDPSK
jgi:hypothetical protein